MPTLRVRDIDVYYEVAGQGEPVLLIHGLGSRSEDWEEQVPALAEHFRVITYDVRGHGRSSKPVGPYSVAESAADAAGLLEALSVGPVHVVGLSMGGMIAFQLMADRPELVKSAVIVNSGPALVPRTAAQKRGLLQRRILVKLLGPRGWAKMLVKHLFPDPAHKSKRETFVRRMSENDRRAYISTQNSLIGWSVLDRVPSMTHPTLVVSSDQDYSPVATKEAYAAMMPNARVAVLENSRHAVPIEWPEKFNLLVLDFLLSQDGRT